jgi:hypothetical protein
VNKRKTKRIIVSLKPEHVTLIKEALRVLGRDGELRFAEEDKTRLREEVLKALEGRAVL